VSVHVHKCNARLASTLRPGRHTALSEHLAIQRSEGQLVHELVHRRAWPPCLQVDVKFLHSSVFEKLQSLYVLNSIGRIQLDLFRSFHDLCKVSFQMESLRNFFHEIGIEWSKSLSANTILAFSNYEVWSHDWIHGQLYDYPDPDFCLFSGFAHRNGILPILDSENLETCTNTIAFLVQYYPWFNATFFSGSIHKCVRPDLLCL
jgi:hypothetical protein